MKKLLIIVSILFSLTAHSQNDTTKWVRAFPLTEYMVDASDSIQIVQVHLPANEKIADRQLVLVKGMYRNNYSDTGVIGVGRCNLIKGDYYYFAINYKESGRQPKEGDLLYTLIDKRPVYVDNIVRLARFYIGMKNVYEKPLYDRHRVFNNWTKKDEEAVVDSMVSDIHFTGNYFLTNNPSMNVKIKSGKREGRLVLNTMTGCSKQDVADFLQYITVRPNLYAGREWKVSEVFATWLTEGAPTVDKN